MLKINTLQAFLGSVLGVRLRQKLLFALVFSLFLTYGCSNIHENTNSTESNIYCVSPFFSNNDGHAKMFSIKKISENENLVFIRSIIGKDTLIKSFLLQDSIAVKKSKSLPACANSITLLQIPLKKVAVLSSAQLGFIERLNARDQVIAISDKKYIADSILFARASNGFVSEVSNGFNVSLEKILQLKPDLVMTFATGGGFDDYERLSALGIPLMLTSEWQESSPMAKAEWIKLFALLFCNNQSNCSKYADSIFEQSKTIYDSIANFQKTKAQKNRPRVLAGISNGGIWYAPGGNSYTAKLIDDAGGEYIWKSDASRELKISMEKIFELADSIDIWINPGMFNSLEEILSIEPRVKEIKALKNKRVYQNNGILGKEGANDFFESAVAKPEEILLNMVNTIFSSENTEKNANSKQNRLQWYQNICNF